MQEIPQDTIIKSIKNKTIQRIYSQFKYLSHQFGNGNNFQNIDKFLMYLREFKFIVYYPSHDFNTVVFCVEDYCIIIKKIDSAKCKKMISDLKKRNICMINITEGESSKEVDSFYKKILKDIKIENNHFINDTIWPIMGFLIRRYYCPSNYFKNSAFFDFKGQTEENSIKTAFYNYISSPKSTLSDYKNIMERITNKKDEFTRYEFKEDEFIILRIIAHNDRAYFYLVIHKESLFVFVMKKYIIGSYETYKEFQHEKTFNEKFGHRCLTRFYGFLKDGNDKINGFIYEFMSNGTLSSFIKSKQEISDHFKLILINRIIQGIDYIHKNKLIHRDIKPDNILIDHDFIPYVSDFDQIRHVVVDEKSEEITGDIGSTNYASPEQLKNQNVSYPTDIFSLGRVIYYIYEKEHMVELIQKNPNLPAILPLNSDSENIKNIYKNCLKYKFDERFTMDQIKSEFVHELDFFMINELLLSDNSSHKMQFLFESLNL